jgi:hypothetical protein
MAILNEVPEGSEVVDLGAARAAREEIRVAEGKSQAFLKLDAGYVQVKPEFSVMIAAHFERDEIVAGLAGLLVDPSDVEALIQYGLSKEDLTEIMKFLTGLTVGES